jgi:hypothetical protein
MLKRLPAMRGTFLSWTVKIAALYNAVYVGPGQICEFPGQSGIKEVQQ